MAGKFDIGDLATGGLSSVGVGPLNVGNVLDTVDFVRKAWSSFGVPSNFAPTVDVDEIDRRIADLKAVEQWLNVNMNMLQGTIQALEIQRGTIATLKAYAGAFGAPPGVPGAEALAGALAALGTSASAAPADRAAAPSVAESAGGASPSFPAAADAAAETAAERVDPDADEVARRAAATRSDESGKATRHSTSSRKSRETSSAKSAGAQPGLDPAAWWNLLQSQFNNIASAAISGAGLASPAAQTGQSKQAKRASPKRVRSSDRGAPVASAKGESRSARSAAKQRKGGGKAKGATVSRRRANKPG